MKQRKVQMIGFTIEQLNMFGSKIMIFTSELGRKYQIPQEVIEELMKNPDKFLDEFENLLVKQLRPCLLIQKDFSKYRQRFISDREDIYPEDMDLSRIHCLKLPSGGKKQQSFFKWLEQLTKNGKRIPLGQRHAEYLMTTEFVENLDRDEQIIFPGTIWENQSFKESFGKKGDRLDKYYEVPALMYGVENFDRTPYKYLWHINLLSSSSSGTDGVYSYDSQKRRLVAFYRMK